MVREPHYPGCAIGEDRPNGSWRPAPLRSLTENSADRAVAIRSRDRKGAVVNN